LSIVSHGQNSLVNELLRDIGRHCASDVSLVLTQNIPEEVSFCREALPAPVHIIRNERPKGFGANHNAAFVGCKSRYFCVMNPDLRLAADPFPMLLETLGHSTAAVAGPLVRTPAGALEDSARRFPTVNVLLKKMLGSPCAPDYPHDAGPVPADWVAGMFMLFCSDAYRAIGGFDERYFLYYEDVDICRRVRKIGRLVYYDPRVTVIHDARRASRRNPRLALHHLASALRFLRRSG
jgi:N-acetylglucosaminyl-diphospho-decaprenol L-rhamnosyltransferase